MVLCRLEIDYNNALSLPNGSATELQERFDAAARAMPGIVSNVLAQVEREELGFWNAPNSVDTLKQVDAVVGRLPKETTDVVVLGVGGSSLGSRALYEATCGPYHLRLPVNGRRLHFADNSDPWHLSALLPRLSAEHTLVIVTSKSGSTLETIATYLVVHEWLKRELGEERAHAHTAVVTSPGHVALRQVATARGMACLPVPENIGGRFSVLSTVGQLPSTLAGIDMQPILAGADRMRRVCESPELRQNPAGILAALNVAHYHLGRGTSVLMPYSDALRAFAAWWAQLWAESLAKRIDRSGSLVETGLTALTAIGATDQHSQLQLFSHGPADKLLTLLRVATPDEDLNIPAVSGPFGYLGGQSLHRVLLAEQRATELALRSIDRPSLRITVPDLSSESLGELLFLFQATTAFAGEMLNINAFDQPGVESGKRLTSAIIGKPGYDKEVAQIREWESEPTRRAHYRDESSFSHEADEI